MRKLIIYASKYGASQTYAEAFSRQTAIPCKNYHSITRDDLAEHIIYFGGLYAGGIKGFCRTLKNFDFSQISRLSLVSVGLSDPKEPKNINRIRTSVTGQLPNVLIEKTVFYHLRGGIDYHRLNLLDRFLMWLVYQKTKKIPENQRNAESISLLATYGQKVDFVNPATLSQIVL